MESSCLPVALYSLFPPLSFSLSYISLISFPHLLYMPYISGNVIRLVAKISTRHCSSNYTANILLQSTGLPMALYSLYLHIYMPYISLYLFSKFAQLIVKGDKKVSGLYHLNVVYGPDMGFCIKDQFHGFSTCLCALRVSFHNFQGFNIEYPLLSS